MNWRLPINHKYLQRLEVIDLPQTKWNTKNKQKQCQTTEFYNSNRRDGGQHTAGCALSVVTTGTATPATTSQHCTNHCSLSSSYQLTIQRNRGCESANQPKTAIRKQTKGRAMPKKGATKGSWLAKYK